MCLINVYKMELKNLSGFGKITKNGDTIICIKRMERSLYSDTGRKSGKCKFGRNGF